MGRSIFAQIMFIFAKVVGLLENSGILYTAMMKFCSQEQL